MHQGLHPGPGPHPDRTPDHTPDQAAYRPLECWFCSSSSAIVLGNGDATDHKLYFFGGCKCAFIYRLRKALGL